IHPASGEPPVPQLSGPPPARAPPPPPRAGTSASRQARARPPPPPPPAPAPRRGRGRRPPGARAPAAPRRHHPPAPHTRTTHGTQRAVRHPVGEIAAVPRQKRRILDPHMRLTDSEFHVEHLDRAQRNAKGIASKLRLARASDRQNTASGENPTCDDDAQRSLK